MTAMPALPDSVRALMGAAIMGEFATMSAAGVPIDTPTLMFQSPDETTIDLATGLAYPAKAERARRKPEVGILLEGGPGEPVVSIAGHAAVRDADLQANCSRYIAETAVAMPGNPPWEKARLSVWYWTRIIVAVTPLVVRWWDNAAAMDEAPHEWRAPPATPRPASDPAPGGTISKAPDWAPRDWRELAASTLEAGTAGHLTLCDDAGFPLPFRCTGVTGTAEGFALSLPAGAAALLRPGKATLCFDGRATFVGTVATPGPECTMSVERCLPVLPLVADPAELWDPAPETRSKLMARLEHEAARRGQPIPATPLTLPEPTAGARRRLARIMAMSR